MALQSLSVIPRRSSTDSLCTWLRRPTNVIGRRPADKVKNGNPPSYKINRNHPYYKKKLVTDN